MTAPDHYLIANKSNNRAYFLEPQVILVQYPLFSDPISQYAIIKIGKNKIENGIQCFVESRNVDLIIMVAKNLNLFQRIFLKPLVEEISYHTEIPFLVENIEGNPPFKLRVTET